VIAAGEQSATPVLSAKRQKRRIEEVLHAIDAGDLVAVVVRQRAQRLTSSRSHGGSISEK
jgi:hypothetical protein